MHREMGLRLKGSENCSESSENAGSGEKEPAARRLLDDALRRIDSGDYGECVMCGKDIAMARLEAIPWARYCVDCQEMQEQGLFGGH